jgi:hypothetical protein
LGSRRLQQQLAQSGREGLRQARAEQGEARGRGKNAPENADEDVVGAR